MKKNHNISTQCGCVDEKGNVFFFSNEINALFKIDKEEKKIKFIISFENEEYYGDSFFTELIYHNGKIIGIPCRSKKIIVFELSTGKIEYIKTIEEDIKAFNCIKINKYEVLLFSVYISEYGYIFNLETYELKIINYKNNILLELNIKNKVFSGKILLENKVYYSLHGENKLLYLNMRDFSLNKYEKDLEFNVSTGIIIDNEKVFLNIEGDAVFFGNNRIALTENDEVNRVDIFSNGKKMAYSNITKYKEDGFICTPVYKNSLCIYQNKELKKIDINWNEIELVGNKNQPYAGVCYFEDEIYLLPYQSNTICIININTYDIEYVKSRITDNEYNEIFSEFILNKEDFFANNILLEAGCSLDAYINILKKNILNEKTELDKEKLTNGEKIYSYIAREGN